VVEEDLWVKKGDKVDGFNGANNAIGMLILRFDEESRMETVLSSASDYVKIIA